MTETQTQQLEGSFLTPAFEHATVADAMRPGVIGCPRDTPLQTVARTMAANHVHSVVVTGATPSGDRPWGIVSDVDLASAANDADDLSAGDVCATEVVSVGPQETLARAAQLMAEHETSHLIVVDPASKQPVGVISTLDLAGIIAWGRA